MYLFLSLSSLFELLLFTGGGTLFLGENICKPLYSLSLTRHLLTCPHHRGAIFCCRSFKLISCSSFRKGKKPKSTPSRTKPNPNQNQNLVQFSSRVAQHKEQTERSHWILLNPKITEERFFYRCFGVTNVLEEVGATSLAN